MKCVRLKTATVLAPLALCCFSALAEPTLAGADSLFAQRCSACHGSRGEGKPGIPILADDDWLYGGGPKKIAESIRGGRKGAMPAHKDLLSETDIDHLASFVVALSKAEATDEGWALYNSKKCNACHGPRADGILAALPSGDVVTIGAANLTDGIWRFEPGGLESAKHTILYGVNQSGIERTRNAACPGIGEKTSYAGTVLDAEDVERLAAYVLGLGQDSKLVLAQGERTGEDLSGGTGSVVTITEHDTSAGDWSPNQFHTWSVPVKSGLSAAKLEQSLKDAATSNNLLFIGESPFYKQVIAITGKSYRYVNFLSFGDAVLMKSLLDYSDRYAAFFPIRIAVVEDREGKLWLHSQNLDIMLQAGEGLSSAAQEAALALQDRVRKTINAVPLAESNAIPLATVAVNKLGDSVQNPRNQNGQQTSSDNDNSSSSGKSDAYMAAKQFLESKYLKCGDVYVAADKETGLHWRLIAGVEFDFREQELSTADRMNGLTSKDNSCEQSEPRVVLMVGRARAHAEGGLWIAKTVAVDR